MLQRFCVRAVADNFSLTEVLKRRLLLGLYFLSLDGVAVIRVFEHVLLLLVKQQQLCRILVYLSGLRLLLGHLGSVLDPHRVLRFWRQILHRLCSLLRRLLASVLLSNDSVLLLALGLKFLVQARGLQCVRFHYRLFFLRDLYGLLVRYPLFLRRRLRLMCCERFRDLHFLEQGCLVKWSQLLDTERRCLRLPLRLCVLRFRLRSLEDV